MGDSNKSSDQLTIIGTGAYAVVAVVVVPEEMEQQVEQVVVHLV